jgi:hypothetical protein
MTITELNDKQEQVLTRIETALAKTRQGLSIVGPSVLPSELYRGFLGTWNTAAVKYMEPQDLNEEWTKQSSAWPTEPDGGAPKYFAGWVLAGRRNQGQTARDLYSLATGHSSEVVSPSTGLV